MAVKLSKSREKVLAKIKDAKAREQLRQSFIDEIEQRQADHAEYIASLLSKPLQHGVTKSGNGVFIANGGTRYGLIVMTAERARQFVSEFKAFKTAVDSLPESDE